MFAMHLQMQTHLDMQRGSHVRNEGEAWKRMAAIMFSANFFGALMPLVA
jgi:hypothetical protein